MRSPRDWVSIKERTEDWALYTVSKRSGRKETGMPGEVGGKTEEFGVLEAKCQRGDWQIANKSNFFSRSSTKVLSHLNVTQKFPTGTTPNNLMIIQNSLSPNFQPLWAILISISLRVSKASVYPDFDGDAACLSTVSCSFGCCPLAHDVPTPHSSFLQMIHHQEVGCNQIAQKV